MTEAEWLTSRFPDDLLMQFDRNTTSERKLRLFACECCRGIWHLMTDERSRHAVEQAELFADGGISLATLQNAADAAQTVADDAESRASITGENEYPPSAAWCAAGTVEFHDVYHVVGACRRDILFAVSEGEEERILATQTEFIRDIFGNPFRPVAFDAAWRTDTALSLARHMYESRDFSAMPILADALQDAGCDLDDILNHCRDANGVHVRGCWVVDFVLGKV